MRPFKFLFLSLIIICFIQSNLYPTISSRIEGTIVDKDTDQPIEDVKVILDSLSRHSRPWGITKTNKDGYFRFNLNIPKKKPTFFVTCSKKGYVPHPPTYYWSNAKIELRNQVVKFFKLGQGEIKHLKINMQKGGSLKVLFFKKDETGQSVWKDLGFFLMRERKPDEHGFEEGYNEFKIVNIQVDELGKILKHKYIEPNKTGFFEIGDYTIEVTEKGEFIIYGLEPFDTYFIEFHRAEYYIPDIKNIEIRQNEQSYIERIIDFSSQTGIQGTILANGKTPEAGSVKLTQLTKMSTDSNLYLRSLLNKEGKYSCRGLPPGKYKISIGIIVGDNSFSKELLVEIKEGHIIVKNFNF